jgi:antitoxin (DNA-binding transcriptional repressor) of toxin-antitoxin stability system
VTFLKLLETVARTGRAVVITKRGRPIARVAPLEGTRGPIRSRARLKGDVVSPLEEVWFAD